MCAVAGGAVADPRAVWRASAGTSKQKSVRMMWSALASALDGDAVTTEVPVEVPVCANQPVPGWCKRPGRLLVTMPDGTEAGVCGLCLGCDPYRGRPVRQRP